MERLTKRDEEGNADYYLYGLGAFDEVEALEECVDRLAAYEDTGLEPEQVTKLIAAHRKAILELSKYRSSVLDALAALERYIVHKKPSAGSCQCREEAEAALKKREEADNEAD